MRPLNTKDRRLAFLKFLLLFVSCLALIMLSVFWTFQVPVKENKLFRESNEQIVESLEFQQKFAEEMENILGLLDSLNLPETNAYYMDQLIGAKLVDLQDLRQSLDPSDRHHVHTMYSNVVQTFLDLQEARKQLRALDQAGTKLAECNGDLTELKSELDGVKRELNICNSLNR
ncbi:MAG: type VI secretion system TssO [Cyclobacteriaceae bacterium]